MVGEPHENNIIIPQSWKWANFWYSFNISPFRHEKGWAKFIFYSKFLPFLKFEAKMAKRKIQSSRQIEATKEATKVAEYMSTWEEFRLYCLQGLEPVEGYANRYRIKGYG